MPMTEQEWVQSQADVAASIERHVVLLADATAMGDIGGMVRHDRRARMGRLALETGEIYRAVFMSTEDASASSGAVVQAPG